MTPNEFYQVDSDRFHPVSLRETGVRHYYIEALEKLIEKLKEKETYTLPTDPTKTHKNFIPTIIFCEFYQKDTEDHATVRLNCYLDRKIFIQHLEGETEE